MHRWSGFLAAISLTAVLAASASHVPKARPRTRQLSISRSMLAAHNRVRAQLHVPPLTWSDSLAQYAQSWATTLATSHQFYHRPHLTFGENLYLIQGGGYSTPEQVVAAWASEARDYDVRTNTCRGPCGHYTQLVWRTTRRVGCGVARRQATEVWVCNYDPPGNIIGERPF